MPAGAWDAADTCAFENQAIKSDLKKLSQLRLPIQRFMLCAYR